MNQTIPEEFLKTIKNYFRLSLWLSVIALVIIFSGIDRSAKKAVKTLESLDSLSTTEYQHYLDLFAINSIFPSSDASKDIVRFFNQYSPLMDLDTVGYPNPKWSLELAYYLFVFPNTYC